MRLSLLVGAFFSLVLGLGRGIAAFVALVAEI